MDYKRTDFSEAGAGCFPGIVGIEVCCRILYPGMERGGRSTR